MLPFVYRVTKYDPADRDDHGRYIGAEDSVSDRGPVESAYLRAVAAFAEEAGVDQLVIREPEVTGLDLFDREPTAEGHGLAGLFPPDLTGFHDGALVPLKAGLELVRAMLRGGSVWCRLEVAGIFAVHVGWDQYLYVGVGGPCERALSRIRETGLFPERLESSPYDAALDEEPGEQRPADDLFWDRVGWFITMRGVVLLEEVYICGASRWYRLTRDTVQAVRAGLTPRARLTVWPGSATDVDENRFAALSDRVDTARSAVVPSPDTDEREPLFTGVLPDGDGVLRARWRTEPTQSDRDWALLKELRRGQICHGTVSAIANFGAFVDIGGFTAVVNIPELSSRRTVHHPSEILTVGQEITARIIAVDMVREYVNLSLKGLESAADDFAGR